MTFQFKRTFNLTVGSINVEQKLNATALRIQFAIERGAAIKDKGPIPPPTVEPNNAEVAVWNLSPADRNALEINQSESQVIAALGASEDREGPPVRLEVGYGDDLTQIFFGNLRKIENLKDGTDWITRISGGDSENKLAFAHVSESFKVGTPHALVLTKLSAALGLGNPATIPPIGALKQTRRFHGPAAEELQAFCASIGYYWSVQNGQVQIGPKGLPALPGVGPLISPLTGLIGRPRIDNRGNVFGTSLILPDLVPGAAFAVASDDVQGAYVTQKTRHYGDSHGNEWYVDFEGAPL